MQENFNDRRFDTDLDESLERPEVVLPPEEDETAKRYGFSFLVNIPLYKHTGNNALLDANAKNELGEIIKNRGYFPRLELLPFKTIVVAVPAEARATRTASGSPESHMRAFEPSAADAQDLRRRIEKTALKCSELFTNNYGKEGGIIIHGLTGIETRREAKELLQLVLPLDDLKIFPNSRREILGEEFFAPFLDEILAFLQSPAARQRITDASRGNERVKERLTGIYNELLIGARNANTFAKGRIAETEQEMSATPQKKSGYDMRDTNFRDAPDPLDLVCLAHRNEIPKSERQLDQARRMQETNNEPLKQVAESMQLVANQMMQQQQPAANSPVGLTAEEIQKMIADGIDKGLSEKFAAADLTTASGAEVQIENDAAPAPATTRGRRNA